MTGQRSDEAFGTHRQAVAAEAWTVAADERDRGRIWIEDDLLRAGYTACFNVLLPARAIGPCDKIVLFGVLSFAWQDDAAWPSIEALSARVGLSRRAVLYALAELKRVGLLKVRRRGQGYTNLYQIPRITQALLERIGAVEPPEPDDEPAADEELVVVEDLTEAAGVTRLSNLILTARGLDATDKLVYVGLKSFAMRKAHCRLKMRTLARRIGMSERTVETHIGRLRAAGLVTRRRRGLGRANVYTLVRIHPAILEAIQEQRYAAPPVDDGLPTAPVRHCPLCRRTLPGPAPPLAAILTCTPCRSALGAEPAGYPQNGNPCTSRSPAHAPPDLNGNACPPGGAGTAVLQVPILPSHAEDPSEEDTSEEEQGPVFAPPGVDDDAARAWAAALAELRGMLSAAAFHTCFQGAEAVSLEGGVFTIAAPHRFAQEWIDVRYRAEAVEALRLVLGHAPELVVVVRQRGPPQTGEGTGGRPDAVASGGAAPRHVWQVALGELRRHLPATEVGAWIESTTAVGEDGRRFTIAAPNSFAKEWIETRARGEIEAALASVLGRRVALGVVVDGTGDAAGRPPGAHEGDGPTERPVGAVGPPPD
jgi:DNA-binding transcriptional ArsR family regulator